MTSILKKVLMALTGLGWAGFAIMHLLGNFQLLAGPEVFNAYAVKLESLGPLIWVADLVLLALLVGHAASGIRVSRENRAARPATYSMKANAGESTLASRTMLVGGVLLLVFIPLHVYMFKFSNKHQNGQMRLYEVVYDAFQRPQVVAFYVLAMIALGMHLSHGLASSFQSLGLMKPGWRPRFRQAGFVLGWAIGLGFAALPVLVFLK